MFRELDTAVGGLSLPRGCDALSGNALITALAKVMHERAGSIRAIFLEALDPAHLPSVGLHALQELLRATSIT